MSKIDTIIFDLGGVLIDWNPEYLYKNIFEDKQEMKWFLEHVCNNDWNVQQDAGRSFEEATNQLIQEFPKYSEEISAFYVRWEEMISGSIQGTVKILEELKNENSYKLYALTNWSSQTFPIAKKRFDFLNYFDGIVVSGDEHTRKPFLDIYQILIDRYEIKPQSGVFIDDNLDNVLAAKNIGLHAIHFNTPENLSQNLNDLGIIY